MNPRVLILSLDKDTKDLLLPSLKAFDLKSILL
jgi:hypothetical protein